MASFLESFGAGFMNRTAEGIDKRQVKAQDYFDAQMELARTYGIENRSKVKSEMAANLGQARQLAQIGVPQDIVISIAKQNPDDIPAFAEKVQKLQAAGVQTDENFFRQLIQVSGEAGMEGETLESVFDKIYEPLSVAAKNDPEYVKNDPGGSIFAAMLGYDAMGQARHKLDTEEVFDGMSAQDLISYGSATPNIGSSTVTMDAGVMGRALGEVEGDEDLTVNERNTLITKFDEEYKTLRDRWTEENQREWATSPDFPEAELRRQAADRIGNVFPEIYRMPEIFRWFEPEEGEEGVIAEELPAELPDGRKLGKDLGDGTSVWIKPDGTKVRGLNSDVFEFMRGGGAPTLEAPAQ